MDQLEPRIRELVIQRLGTYYRAPVDKRVLDQLPRKIWVFRVPKEWKIGEYDWTGRPDTEKLVKRYEARLWLGSLAHLVGLGVAVVGAWLSVVPWEPLGPVLVAGGLTVGAIPWILQAFWRRRLHRGVTREELKLATVEIPLSRGERLYLELLEEVCTLPRECDREVARTLETVNEAMERYRVLLEKRALLPVAPDQGAISRVSYEIERVRDALGKEADPFIRSAQEERLAALEATKANLESVGTLARRIDAQLRTIESLLQGVKAAFARMRLAPALEAEDETRQLSERLHRMAQQSSALEAAVEEIRSLQS